MKFLTDTAKVLRRQYMQSPCFIIKIIQYLPSTHTHTNTQPLLKAWKFSGDSGVSPYHKTMLWRYKRPNPDGFFSLTRGENLRQGTGRFRNLKRRQFHGEGVKKGKQNWILMISTMVSCEKRIIKKNFLPSRTVFHKGNVCLKVEIPREKWADIGHNKYLHSIDSRCL